MKRYYSKPVSESIMITSSWALCTLDGSGETGKVDPTPKPPMPKRTTPAF